MAAGVARALKGKRDPGAALAAQIVVATTPALLLGFILIRYVELSPRSLVIIGDYILDAVGDSQYLHVRDSNQIDFAICRGLCTCG